MAASATGISQYSQRCLTSTLFVCYGRRRDPWQTLLKELVLLWITLMPTHFQERPFDLRIAWSDAKSSVVCRGSVVWGRVTGLLSNVVANLIHIGWNPVSFSEWVDPDGDTWSLGTSEDSAKSINPALLIYKIQDSAAQILWSKASSHHLGAGLDRGFAFSYTMTILHKFRKEKRYDWAAALETIMCGACWPPSRKADAGLVPQAENVCKFCGHEGVDDFHQFWGCPSLDSSEWPEVKATQYLVPRAKVEGVKYPCLWLRGLLPSNLCVEEPIPPPIDHLQLYVYDPHSLTPDPHVWPPGLYGTDGSGGELSAYPELRRVGCGVSRVDCTAGGGFDVIWSANFALPGDVQTVPRGELFAICIVVEHVSHGIVTICSDSLINIDLFNKGLNFAVGTSNGDLWRRIRDAIQAKSLTLRLHWVQGHLDKVAPVQHFPEIHVALNFAADVMADSIAARIQHPMHVSSGVLFHVRLVKRIQLRLCRILISHLEKVTYDKKIKIPLGIQDALDMSPHCLVPFANGWKCLHCGGSTSRKAASHISWLMSSCFQQPFDDSLCSVPVPSWHQLHIGTNVVHSSHVVHSVKGVAFCTKCGHFGSKKIVKLAQPCSGHTTAASATHLLKLKQGQLPTKSMTWPLPPQARKAD